MLRKPQSPKLQVWVVAGFGSVQSSSTPVLQVTFRVFIPLSQLVVQESQLPRTQWAHKNLIIKDKKEKIKQESTWY